MLYHTILLPKERRPPSILSGHLLKGHTDDKIELITGQINALCFFAKHKHRVGKKK